MRRLVMLLGVIALLAWIGLPSAHAQVDNGWIQSDQYNMLFPLLNPDGCGGGGAAKMAGNWVAPHDIATETPAALEVWNDIDFGGAALAAGWGGGTIPGAADPIWITNASFEAAFVLPAGSMPVYQGVDFQALSVWINDTLNALDPPPDPPVALPNDNVLGIATTYVENTSGAPLLVDICSASDDSIQVWVNNVMTTNVSACRGWSGNCQERRAAILPTGVSKITGLVWEGGGGWGLRIGLEVDGVKVDEPNNFGITFLGPTGTTQEQYAAERLRGPEDPQECVGAEDAEVIITGNGVGDPADALTVVETVSFTPGADVTVDASASGGDVADVIAPDDGILLETGAALEFFVLGPIANPGGAAPGVPAIQQSYLAGGDGIINTLNEGDVVADIDAVDQTVRRIGINSGDALDFNQVGGDGDNIMHYAWTKVTLADERQVVVGGGSDDSVQLLVNGVEVALHNGGRGFGGFGEIQDFTVSCVLTLGAGTHTILAKVYEGGGGHGVRVVMLERPAGGVGPGSVDCATATPIAPGEYGVGCTKGAATGIAACPDAQVSGAHYYVVTGTGGDITVETCGPQFLYDTHMVVFQDCVAITCVAQNDDTCGRQSQITFASTAGQDYIIQVHGWDNREGPYVLKVSDASNPPADVNPVPLTGSGVCADPDGVCDTEAETVVAKQITWDTTRGDVDAGLSYTVATTTAANVNLSGSVETAAGDPDAVVSGFASLGLVAGNSGPVGAFDDSRDIGNPPIAGSISDLGGGQYRIDGSGNDIWDGGDDFFFAYQYITGDFIAQMRVLTRSESPERWGRHGIMARRDCGRDSKMTIIETQAPTAIGAEDFPRHHMRLFHNNNGNNRDYYQANDGTFPTEGRLPTWFRLIRQGNVLYGYLAEDADADDQPDNWCLIGSDSAMDRPDELLVGVAIHGRANQSTEITFDNWSVVPLEDPADIILEKTDTQVSVDYTAPDGTEPAGSRIAVRGGGFRPQIIGERLRLTEENIGSSAVAVWYESPELLNAEDGFYIGFDAFMTRAVADPPENSNPADGMTMAVVQGPAADLVGTLPDCLTAGPKLTTLDNALFIGNDAGAASVATDLGGGSYTSASTSSNDIWTGGDDFLFQYSIVSGDFDVSCEVTNYNHNLGAGQWGKYGLMARQSDNVTDPAVIATERGSRYTMVQGHGPADTEAARVALRPNHFSAGGATDTNEETPVAGAAPRPRFLRLTRRGNVFQGWISENPGLADGTLDPCNDCNWVAGRAHDWGPDAPADVLVGFANSEHNSDPDSGGDPVEPATQTVDFQILQACDPGAGVELDISTDFAGDGGGAMGYDAGTLRERIECHPSFAVEMDNWVGGGEPGNEPPDGGSPDNDYNWHTGLLVNASVSAIQTNVDFGVATGDLPDIFAPEGVHFDVFYAPTGQIDVFVNDVQVMSRKIPPLQGSFLFGFTGGTGGATCTQEVDNLVLAKVVEVIPGGNQKPGDENQDGNLDITDPVEVLNHLFLGTNPTLPCGDGSTTHPANVALLDANADGAIDISDAVGTLQYLFLGGPPLTACAGDPACPCVLIVDCDDSPCTNP